MKFGSLFSGIGGLDLGLEWAGHECRWQVENDDYCSRVLAKHWPHVTRYGDINEVDFELCEPVELLAGGFPCQDLSYAGKGLGLSGPRSGLWSEFKRAVRVARPRYVLVENVPALLGRGMGVVVGDLADMGFDTEWQSLPASAFGAPHRRERIFILAYSSGLDEHARGVLEQGAPRRSSFAARGLPRMGEAEGWRLRGEWLEREPDVERMVTWLPARMDRLRGLGNAVVPQVAQYLGELLAEHQRSAA